MNGSWTPGRVRSLLMALLAAVLLSLLWNVPVVHEEAGWVIVPVSFEVLVMFALAAWFPRLRSGRLSKIAAGAVAVFTTFFVILKLCDLTLRVVLGRPLNPYLDVQLLTPIVHLLTGMLGTLFGWLATALLALVPLPIVGLVYLLCRGAQHGLQDRGIRRAALVVCAAFTVWFATGQQVRAWLSEHPPKRLVAGDAVRTVAGYGRAARQTIEGVAEIRRTIANDRFETVPATSLLDGLRGADVVLVFFESYGRSALEHPRFAAIPRTLTAFEQRLRARGLHSASAWLTSPIVGGQSWLAAGTFTSGLWLPDQGRYDAAMESTRLTFARAFTRAGYRTVAIKPAVTHPWPEGAKQGFSKVYAAADLGYAGKAFNWITMPDQYTLSALQRAEPRSAARPLFAEVSLISSHSPWTPIPPVLTDWDGIGDGRVFSQWAESGLTPDEVWSDFGLMQKQYGLSVDYVLKVLAGYAERFVDDRTLLIVVGDHQPPVFISGEGAGADVPIHVVSGDPRLLDPFLKAGFTSGMRPATTQPPARMDTFRDFFFDTFSEDATLTRHPPE